jgi:hypothetical protein
MADTAIFLVGPLLTWRRPRLPDQSWLCLGTRSPGANSPEFHFDGAHVNTAGHAHIAEKFLESWATLI